MPDGDPAIAEILLTTYKNEMYKGVNNHSARIVTILSAKECQSLMYVGRKIF